MRQIRGPESQELIRPLLFLSTVQEKLNKENEAQTNSAIAIAIRDSKKD
jgi:hypothetical protein